MLNTIATGFERKLESSNKKIETLASKSKSLANSLKAEKLKSRSAMKQLLLLTTTQMKEFQAKMGDDFKPAPLLEKLVADDKKFSDL